MAQQAQRPDVAARSEELRRQGLDEGSSLLIAVEESMGTQQFFEAVKSLRSHQKLLELAQRSQAQ